MFNTHTLMYASAFLVSALSVSLQAGPGSVVGAHLSVEATEVEPNYKPLHDNAGVYRMSRIEPALHGKDSKAIIDQRLIGEGIVRHWLPVELAPPAVSDWSAINNFFDEMTQIPGPIMLNIARAGGWKHMSDLDAWAADLERVVRHLVERYPGKIRYIESANELYAHVDDSAYVYRAYKVVNAVVNRINTDYNLTGTPRELQYGGPALATTTPVSRIRDFLNLYMADDDPQKRLDFLSVHRYADGPNVRGNATLTYDLKQMLAERGLGDMPVMITETSQWSWNTTSQVLTLHEDMAVGNAGTLALHYWGRKAGAYSFFYGDRHRVNSRKDTFYDDDTLGHDSRLTAHGFMRAMLGKMGRTGLKLYNSENIYDADGRGLYAEATRDDAGRITVLVWNYQYLTRYQPNTYEVRLNISGLSQEADPSVRRWLIDATHSNPHYDPAQTELHETSFIKVNHLPGSVQTEFTVEPNSVTLVEVSP